MKVSELIAQLENFDPNNEVYLSYPSHNYWQETFAAKLSKIGYASAKNNGYELKVLDSDVDQGAAITIFLLE